MKDYVFFPITEPSLIPNLLNDLSYQLQQLDFPQRVEYEPIADCLQDDFPNVNWKEISLKFDQLGEIAVVKLDSTSVPDSFRQRVGELILSRYPRLKTVLNKRDIIEGTERVYPTEHLAGEKIWGSWHQEYGVFIFVDLKRAYFNPRLAEEHHRVAMSGIQGEKILDLFTGVGPFALHCAKRFSCNVTAIDINPFAIKALQKSIARNKLQGDIHPIIGDSQRILRLRNYFDRIIINLPQKSINFLPYATKLLKKGGIVTFYQFISKSMNPIEDIRKLVKTKLGKVNSYKELYIKVGREISPSKLQMNIDLQID